MFHTFVYLCKNFSWLHTWLIDDEQANRTRTLDQIAEGDEEEDGGNEEHSNRTEEYFHKQSMVQTRDMVTDRFFNESDAVKGKKQESLSVEGQPPACQQVRGGLQVNKFEQVWWAIGVPM